MTLGFVISLGRDALLTVLLVSAPMLILGMLVGLIISIFQATTQIHEQTLSFVPKIVAVLVAMVAFGPWMITKLLDFTSNLLSNLPLYIR
ncbi:MAG: flagellar biosynthesis protein FliQ [Chloroflexota bacterium]